MMRIRTIHVIVGFLVLATSTAVLAGPSLVGPAACRERPEVTPEWDSAVAIQGDRIVGTHGGTSVDLTTTDPCGDVVAGAGLLRHLAVGDTATAVVNDLAGADQLLALDDEGVAPMDTHGEVTHPAWSPDGRLAWAEDLEVIRIASADRAAVTTLLLPPGALSAFSPYFAGRNTIVAVVQQPSPATTHEDDGLDNLFSFDFTSQRWTKITRFTSRSDRWSAIRTPVVAPDGSVWFVRITADPSATKTPRFELWRAEPSRIEKVRTLPGEMYLAGVGENGLLWNALSRSCNGWGLFAETADGLREVTCGRVSVDPLEVDPDAAAATDAHGHDDGDDHDVASGDARISLAVLVGDFGSPARARAILGSLPDGLPGRVIDHAAEENLVRPGAWAVVVPVTEGTDPDFALEVVRNALKGCRCGAWLAPVSR